MIASELINPVILPLQSNDTVLKALDRMEELRLSELPVMDKGVYAGLLRDPHFLEQNNPDTTVANFSLVDKQCFVYEHQHFYDVIKAAADFNVQSVPVLDMDGTYKGIITLEDTIAAFAQTAAVQSPGAIFILSLKQIDYSLAEISRLIESDSAKILCSSVNSDTQDPSKIKLTIKVNKTDLSRIIATLERFGYKIIASFQEAELISNDKDRLDILLKYLDI
jgi:acetoin utilization protein AcuB